VILQHDSETHTAAVAVVSPGNFWMNLPLMAASWLEGMVGYWVKRPGVKLTVDVIECQPRLRIRAAIRKVPHTQDSYSFVLT